MVINFSDINAIKDAGFTGFRSIKDYYAQQQALPDSKGVYIILMPEGFKRVFVQQGSGGFFKGKNPNVSIAELEQNWINNTPVLYIGKASSLRKRLRQYFQFGDGKNVGHYGGRFIWQLSGAKQLLVAWLPTPHYDPESIESGLIQDFREQFLTRPFANLTK